LLAPGLQSTRMNVRSPYGTAGTSHSSVERSQTTLFDRVVGLTAFLGAALLIGATAVLLSASLRLASFTAFLLACYLFAAAEFVVLAEALSPFHAVTRVGYLIGVATAALASAVVWWARGHPRPPSFPTSCLHELLSQPVVCALGVAVFLGLVYELSVGLTTPPNNWDSLFYHLVRPAAWRQHHAVEYIPHVNGDLGINTYPPNAELQILFGFVVLGRDTFATIPQFLAEAALLVSIFGIARRVGFDFVASVFAALASATLSIVALESVTTQNDLCVAAVVTSAIFFALGDRRTDIALAGLAVGLALGTKVTAILALPMIGLVAFAAGGKRRLLGVATSAAVGFAAFGAFVYVLNIVHTGKLFGDPAGQDTGQAQLSVVTTLSTTLRSLYRFLDLSGFQHLLATNSGTVLVLFLVPSLALAGAAVARSTASPNVGLWASAVALAALAPFAVMVLAIATRGLFYLVHIPLNPPGASGNEFIFSVNGRSNEDSSYFGPLGILLVWPLSIAACIAWARGRIDRRIGALAAALPIYLLLYAATVKYQLFSGRYFIVPVAAVMPLAAHVCRSRVLMRATAVIGIAVLILSHAFNETKPVGLAGSRPIWALSGADAQALTRPPMQPVLERVAQEVPQDAHVGVVLTSKDWSYPFYGSDLGRTVTYLPRPPSSVEPATPNVAWLVVHLRKTDGRRSVWQITKLPNGTAVAKSRSLRIGSSRASLLDGKIPARGRVSSASGDGR
jgi:hypothetical protein